jgi:hypothetical protein
MSKDYFPTNEPSIVQWNENFKTQLAEIGVSLGFTEEDIATISATCTGMDSVITNIEVLKAKLKEQTEEKNTTLESGTESIRNFVKRIKAAPTYTEAQGKLLGIVGEGSSFDPTTAMPVIKLSKTGTGYNFAFSLHGYFDAVAVFRKMPTEENYSQVGIDMKSPYSITPPSVSGCEYYFQYLKNDDLVGLKSDIVVIEL